MLIALLIAVPAVAQSPAKDQNKKDGKDQPAPSAFDRDVAPILIGRCVVCHNPSDLEGGLDLTSHAAALAGGESGPALVPGRAEESYLLERVREGEMPPEKKGRPLTKTEVASLAAWIKAGARWPAGRTLDVVESRRDWWSLKPPLRPAVPRVKHQSWVRNPIDAFIARRLESKDLSPSAEADRVALIRRLAFDLHGLPPTPEQVRAFVDDRSPDAYDKLVRRRLASPRYGERWARHWLDVVRFAETNGFETNTPRPNAWRYRDWVIDALNRDLPYDQFVVAQLAGDAVGEGAATGFLVAGAYDTVKSPDVNLTLMQRQNELADMVNTTSTTFLGITVGCARCHDHKFDPVLQKDFYSMQAVFAGVNHGDRVLRAPQTPELKKQADDLRGRIAGIKTELDKLKPAPLAGRAVVLDDETLATAAAVSPGVSLLAKKNGHGVNPPGTGPGQRDDPGGVGRAPNVSGGRYTWWTNTPGVDVAAYRPAVAGRFRVWLSWGRGFATHTTDARYVLDADGEPATKGDQAPIATIDQQQRAGGSGPPPSQPLWSGFANAGVHEFTPTSRIILRGGERGTAITADVIVLEEASDKDASPRAVTAQPRLRRPVNSRRNEEHFPPVVARFVRFNVQATNVYEPCLDELEVYSTAAESEPPKNVALASAGAKATSSGDYSGNPFHQLKHVHDGVYGNERSWISNENGRGWVRIELARPTRIDRIVWGRDRNQKYKDRTATRYVIEVAAEPDQWQTVAGSAGRLPAGLAPHDELAYSLASLPPEQARRAATLLAELKPLEERYSELTAKTTRTAYAGTFSQPAATHRLYRGDPLQPREVVPPDALSVVGSLKLGTGAAEQQRRLALARWIADKHNPLTARVIVNRLWHYHFGRGLVSTPSDFGRMGSRPSHPQLLDWLACELVEGGWSLKHLHALILTSATYRQSTAPGEQGRKTDSQSVLLWRFPPRRLEAEAIRDAMLATGGVLDLRMGGPGFDVFEPNTNYVRNYIPKETFGPAEWRRMVYMVKVRMEQDAVFGTFDCPDAGQPAPKRSRSTTAIQALNLLNSGFVLQQSELFAQRLVREAGQQPAAQVERAFLLAFGRPPDEAERRGAAALVDSHGLAALCRGLLNANEFLFVP